MTDSEIDRNRTRVWRYYDRTESRLGYEYLLGGTKHYGWYEPGDAPWRFKPAMRRMEDELAQRLSLPAGSRVLDAGCGTGAVARALATRHALKVTGIDLLDWNLESAIKQAGQSGLSDVTHFRWADYHSLPFGSGEFAGAYTMETLVHSPAPDQVLGEFYRVLQPGGRAAFFEYSHRPRTELTSDAWDTLQRVCDAAAMPGWLQFEDGVLDAKLRTAGFVDVGTEDITDRMAPMVFAFAKLGRFPYFVGRLLRRTSKTVNAMSAVELSKYLSA